jgi:hypothetical protein
MVIVPSWARFVVTGHGCQLAWGGFHASTLRSAMSFQARWGGGINEC